jgi:hypothetical protein
MYSNYDRNDQPHLQGLVSPINKVCVFPLSTPSEPVSEPSSTDDANIEFMGLGQALDPLGDSFRVGKMAELLAANGFDGARFFTRIAALIECRFLYY